MKDGPFEHPQSFQAARDFENVRKLEGEDAPAAIVAMKRLALAYSDEGNLAKARTLLTEVFKKQKQGQEGNLGDVTDTAHHLGVLLYRIGDYSSASIVQQEALSRILERDGRSSDAAIVALYNLGVTLIALGEFTALVALGNPIIDGRLSLKCSDAPVILRHIYWMASWWRYLGEVKRSSSLYKRVTVNGVRSIYRTFPIVMKSVLAEIFVIPPGLLALKVNPNMETAALRRRAVMRHAHWTRHGSTSDGNSRGANGPPVGA